MVIEKKIFVTDRMVGRRDDDYQTLKFKKIANVGQLIVSEMNLDILLDLIMDQTVHIMGAKRCTIFLHDENTNQLWSKSATRIKKHPIFIPSNIGVASWVFTNREPVIIDDAYSDQRFYPDVDGETGFNTKSILCIPLLNKSDKCIGVLQLLNKINGKFTQKDKDLLVSISHYISIALENANLYEELKSINKARKKVIDHLSHELLTPVVIIQASLNRISKVLSENGFIKLEKPISRCRRNLERLTKMREVITDILTFRIVDVKERMTHLVESFFSITEIISENMKGSDSPIHETILNKLESIYGPEKFILEELYLEEFLHNVKEVIKPQSEERDIEILLFIESGLKLYTDDFMLKKVCIGFIKNAIEGTPDGGKIRIEAKKQNSSICLEFRDWGIGITAENQKNIFNGFYHTHDTNYYSSKRPYAFYAGGAGSDLLRTKVFSERHGFSINFSSSRCRFIPEDNNLCPGKIADCQFIKGPEDCYASGGSQFSLIFNLIS